MPDENNADINEHLADIERRLQNLEGAFKPVTDFIQSLQDGVLSQIEGNVIQTLSRTLKEELTFSSSAVTSLDWSSYPILTFPEVPEMVIDLIDRPAEKPWGAGEPSAAVVPSAISNAVFDATGVRLRSVPFTPEKVKEALRRGA